MKSSKNIQKFMKFLLLESDVVFFRWKLKNTIYNLIFGTCFTTSFFILSTNNMLSSRCTAQRARSQWPAEARKQHTNQRSSCWRRSAGGLRSGEEDWPGGTGGASRRPPPRRTWRSSAANTRNQSRRNVACMNSTSPGRWGRRRQSRSSTLQQRRRQRWCHDP